MVEGTYSKDVPLIIDVCEEPPPEDSHEAIGNKLSLRAVLSAELAITPSGKENIMVLNK